MPYYRPGRSVAKLITYNNVFVGMSVSTRVPILTASPEKASAIVRTPYAVTAHPFQKLAGIHRRTGNTNGPWYFTYH